MKNVNYWIRHLDLQHHPEGGYYREVYRSSGVIQRAALPEEFNGDRCFSTAIYYLVVAQKCSKLHKIKSDELWHFYYGDPLEIYVLEQNKSQIEVLTLGPDPEYKQQFQFVIPKNAWFGAKVEGDSGYSLVGCTVSPGFDFEDFELADRTQLINIYPQHQNIITSLT